MRSIFVRSFLFFCLLALTTMQANASPAGSSSPAKPAAVDQAIPVQILGKTIEIRNGMTRPDAKSALSALTREEASVDTDERLQYDLTLVPGNAPVTIYFDFDKKGVVNGFALDAFSKKQNPPAAKLVEWLNANAGKPQVKKKGKVTWVFAGWKIEHEEGGSGEDSTYRVEFTRSK
jgi:hypothetical protein